MSFISGHVLAKTTIHNVRFWVSPHKTRLVLDTSHPLLYQNTQHKKSTILNLVNINLPYPSFSKLQQYSGSNILDIRLERNRSDLILNFNQAYALPATIFALKPNAKYPYYRLVLDFYTQAKTLNIKQKSIKKTLKKVVVIDAGHGGDDPGSIGRGGSYEKNITLSIAKKLAKKLNQSKQYKAILTRASDYYIALSTRVRLAQKHQADLFISIHADSVNNTRAKGASIYTLSAKGASTKFAKRLEKSENSADQFGGVDRQHKDKYLHEILWDFSRSNKDQQSQSLAINMLTQLQKVGKLHKSTPQKAGFVVLKIPSIPSVLIETAFISNKADERYLNSRTGQNNIAQAIFKGIKQYYQTIAKK